MRVRIDLAYDGTAFRGWATQPGWRTVQGDLEAALGTVLRSDPPSTTCAGRTDAGVHARGQVVHIDLDGDLVAASTSRVADDPLAVLMRRLNGVLTRDVRVRRLAKVPDEFDARFSALWRRYAYRVVDDPAAVDPLARGHVLSWRRRLDVELMNQASSLLVGEHDFAAFCKRREGATTIRTLLDLGWRRDSAGILVAEVRADAFCRHMVRSVVGCLMAVGEGTWPPAWAADILSAAQRDPAVHVVPARGLTLEEVGYPAHDQLAAQADRTRVLRTLPGA